MMEDGALGCANALVLHASKWCKMVVGLIVFVVVVYKAATDCESGHG